MSDGIARSEKVLATQKVNAERVAVRSSAWLDFCGFILTGIHPNRPSYHQCGGNEAAEADKRPHNIFGMRQVEIYVGSENVPFRRKPPGLSKR